MKKIFLLLVLLVGLNGCASILSTSSYPLTITTDPSDAQVTVRDHRGTDIYKGNSPATVTLDASIGFFKKATYQVVVNKLGFQEQIVPVNFKTDGWYWGNLLLGGVIGMLIVDPATGAMYKIESEYMAVTLSPSVAQVSPELRIYDLESLPEELKSKMVKISK